YAQLGLSPAFRLDVGGVHFVGREVRLGVPLEEIELVCKGVLDLPRELPPVIRCERAGTIEDLAERRGRHVAAEVDARETEPARDGNVLGGQLDEEAAALVRTGGFPLGYL